jgi:hypothetical protein
MALSVPQSEMCRMTGGTVNNDQQRMLKKEVGNNII